MSRRCPAVVALLAAIVLMAALALAGCGSDPFSGVWWEPATGRRIEIRELADGYQLLYGAEKRPYAAVRDGDELTIAQPFGALIVIQADDDGTLRLVGDGPTTRLQRLPESD